MSTLYPTPGLYPTPAAPAASVTTVRTVKVKYGDEMRRFPFPIDNTVQDGQYAPLVHWLASAFELTLADFKVTYTDDEGDAITLGSDAELAEALRCATDSILRIEVTRNEGSEHWRGRGWHGRGPHGHGRHWGPPRGCPRGMPPHCRGADNDDEEEEGDHQQFGEGHHGGRWHGPHGPHGRGFGHGDGLGFGFGCGWGKKFGKAMAKGQLFARKEELEAKYAEQVAALKAEGLPHGPFVLCALENSGGDLESVRPQLLERKERLARAEALFEGELNELRERGLLLDEDAEGEPGMKKCWGNPKVHCIRMLMKFDGDVEKVAKKLQKWQDKRECWKEKTDELKTRFGTELRQLEEMGFTNTHCLIRLLNQCGGNVEKVLAKLEKQERKQQKKKKWGEFN